MKILKKFFTYLITIIVLLAVLLIGILYFLEKRDDGWSITPREIRLNESLAGNEISEIDNQIRSMDFFKNEKIYLNEIVLRTSIDNNEIYNTTMEILYVDMLKEVKGEKRFKSYIKFYIV